MIEIPIGPNLFSTGLVGSLLLSWHGFLSFVAIATAVLLIGRWAPLRGIDPDAIYSIAVWVIIGGIVGARLVHVVDYWAIYQKNPEQILYIWKGGIGLWGGILGGLIGGSAYALIAKHPVGAIADLSAPAVLFAQAIGRVGDIVNGEHCAKATDFFLGFSWTHVDSAALVCASGFTTSVQPVILYEMVWTTMALAIVWHLRGRLKPDGMLFALYLALYAAGRFAVSFAREDRIWAYGMQEAHYIALLVLLITVPLLAIKARFTERVEEAPLVVERQPTGTRAQRRRPRR